MTQATADVATGVDGVAVADADKASDTEWLMVDPVREPVVTLTEAERCICATPCGGFRCEARVCPASGSMKFVFCEDCSDYMCECNIHGRAASC